MKDHIKLIFLIILTIFSCLSCQRKNQREKLVVKTVEAEDCYKKGTGDCYTSGKWKVWSLSKFSKGQLINNEDPEQMGRASNSSSFYLNFKGTGVTIVYRQDTWYGSLGVEIDEKKVGIIKQRGIGIKNQAKKYFDASGMGKHSLILRGSEATGVITIDAIKIHGNF